jgi:hypothetical protein
MRLVLLGLCAIVAGCAGEAPTSPTASTSTTASLGVTEARAGTELPFRGTLEAVETH